MYNKIKTMWSIFKNDNEWNEKTVDSFMWIVIGCFGIAGAEKFAKK